MSSDFHLFGLPKEHLAGKQFAKYASVKQTLHCWLQTLDTDFYYTNIKAMVPCWDNCLNVSGDYRGESDEYLLQPVCHAYIRSQNQFLSPEFLLLYIL
jgi:hypothetical protein